MNALVLIISALGLLLLKGCASIVSGSNEPVTFNSITSSSEFGVKNECHIIVYHGITPTMVTLEIGNGYFDGQTHKVDFTVPNYLSKSQIVDTEMNATVVKNIN